MKGVILAPVLAALLAVSVVGGLTFLSSASQAKGGILVSREQIPSGAFSQNPVPSPHPSADAQEIGSGVSNPSLLTALFLVVGAAALFGGASAFLSRRTIR